jgi:hypothetical protein
VSIVTFILTFLGGGMPNYTTRRALRTNDWQYMVVITGDYYTPIVIWRKSVSVRKCEQSCFTGRFGWVKLCKGESKVRAIVDKLASKATYFSSSATTLCQSIRTRLWLGAWVWQVPEGAQIGFIFTVAISLADSLSQQTPPLKLFQL